MKHTKHEDRKSFRKWAVPSASTQTLGADMLDLRRMKAFIQGREHHVPNIGRNNGPVKHSGAAQIFSQHTPAFLGTIKGYIGFLPRNAGRSNDGARVPSKGKIIPSHEYCPRAY